MKKHLVKALSQDIRFDGRVKDQFRDVKVEYGVSANAEGSARVTIGDTIVIAGVKLNLAKPYADSPNAGTFMVNAELLPMSNGRFESGPPSIESIEIARVIDRGVREAGAIDVKKLCITPGESVWGVSVDIIPINASGNLMDAAGLAVLAALKDTKYPKVLEDGSVSYKEHTDETLPLNKEPIPVTVYKVGDQLLVDPVENEEFAATARLTVASISDSTICAMQKGGLDSLSIDEIDTMVGLAIAKSKELRKAL